MLELKCLLGLQGFFEGWGFGVSKLTGYKVAEGSSPCLSVRLGLILKWVVVKIMVPFWVP